MAGLWKALLCLLLQVASGWPWGPIEWQHGMRWREHIPTGYWAEVDGYGELVWEEDMDWFEDHGYDLPGNWMPAPPPPPPIRTPPTPPRTRFSPGNLRVACKRPRLPAIDEQDDIGYGGGTASTEPPRPPTPPRSRRHQSNHEEVMETLKNLGALLDDQHEQGRYESRGFRSAVRRQMKKLCNRYSLQYPPWLDGTGMSVKQFKNRVRWFMEDFVVQQTHQPRPRNAPPKSPKSPKSPSGDGLKKAPPTSDGTACAPGDNSSNSSSSSSMNVECPGNPPPATGMEVPSGTVGSADEGPSSAVVISHMMDNLLDDLEQLHPGARQEAQQSVCEGLPAEGTTSELLPEGPASSGLPATGTGLPEEGTAGPSGLPAEGTAVDTEVEDPRKTKSEPPLSPRNMETDEGAATPPCNPEGPGVEAAESSWPAEGPSTVGSEVAAESTMGDSWEEVHEIPDDLSTVASVTLEDD